MMGTGLFLAASVPWRCRCSVDSDSDHPHNSRFRSEGFPSGQRDQTVNLTALPSKVRILPPPPKPVRNGTGDGVRLGCQGFVRMYRSYVFGRISFEKVNSGEFTGSSRIRRV